MLTTLEDAEKQMNEIGLDPDLIELDGQYHRCQYAGEKRSKMSGFYKLREIAREENILVDGIFGSFKISERPFVTERRVHIAMSNDKFKRIKENYLAKLNQQMDEEKQRHDEAAIRAEWIWENASDVGKSPYLDKKMVGSHGLKFNKSALLVPMVREGKLRGLQCIGADGFKKYLPGSDTKGVYHLIRGSNRVALCEGYATGASIHMATGWSVAVCFSTNGIVSAAPYFKKKDVLICADNDRGTELKIGKNPGLLAARKAAEYLECKVLVPKCENIAWTDFNDIHVSLGIDEVTKQCSQI
jgi:putative DNA primase/helicase